MGCACTTGKKITLFPLKKIETIFYRTLLYLKFLTLKENIVQEGLAVMYRSQPEVPTIWLIGWLR
jgi:hypothetical protein